MTVWMYRDIHTLQPYIIDFTQRGCHTLRYIVTVCKQMCYRDEIRLKFLSVAMLADASNSGNHCAIA